MMNFFLKICVSATILLFAESQAQEASISDALLIKNNLKLALNVRGERTNSQVKDTAVAKEIWFVPNGMSIQNYMLKASREIERCKGRIHWMREIRGGRAALLKYEGEQGIYPLTEVRIIDTLWLPGSSKLAVILAVREGNTLLKNNPNLLETLPFDYNLLVPSSRQEHLEAAKKTKANIIPWVPMESKEMVYATEKKNRISISVANEKELSKRLDTLLKKYDNVTGFAAFYGEDFLAHQASIEKLGNVLQAKNLWFLDLSLRGSATLSLSECKRKNLRCEKTYLDAESEESIKKTLRKARKNGNAILLFELNEKSIELLKKLPAEAEKQGTKLVLAGEVF